MYACIITPVNSDTVQLFRKFIEAAAYGEPVLPARFSGLWDTYYIYVYKLKQGNLHLQYLNDC